MTKQIEWSASLLAANPLTLHEQLVALKNTSIQCLHIDIMDLDYVPNLGLSLLTLNAITQTFPEFIIDIHYMVKNIDQALTHSKLATLPIRRVFFHPETSDNPANTIHHLNQLGIQAGIAIKPSSEISTYNHLWPLLNSCLIMGVEPGFSGQTFNPKTLSCLETMHDIATKHSLQIAVDGGVNPHTLAKLKKHSIDHAVLGSALFNNTSIKENLRQCEKAIRQFATLDPQS